MVNNIWKVSTMVTKMQMIGASVCGFAQTGNEDVMTKTNKTNAIVLFFKKLYEC